MTRMLSALLLSLALTACGREHDANRPPVFFECASDADCLGSECNFGYCQGKRCSADSDCPQGDECLEGEGVSLCRSALSCFDRDCQASEGECQAFVEGEPEEICVVMP